MTMVTVDVETIPDESKVGLFNRLTGVPEDKMDTLFGLPGDEDFDNAYVKLQSAQMSIIPEYARIVGLNYMAENLEPVSKWVGEYLPSQLHPTSVVEVTERTLLRKFWELARENSVIVTYNGLGFDLEVIKVRSAILGIEPTCDLTNLKPWENRHIDMMKRLYGTRKAMKLKVIREVYWGKLIEFEPMLEDYADLLAMEGDSVYELYKQGDIATLKRYGEFDALTNMALYQFGLKLWW